MTSLSIFLLYGGTIAFFLMLLYIRKVFPNEKTQKRMQVLTITGTILTLLKFLFNWYTGFQDPDELKGNLYTIDLTMMYLVYFTMIIAYVVFGTASIKKAWRE